MMRTGSRALALLALLAVVAAGCGKKPAKNGSGGAAAPKSNFLACEVTDTGGIDDRSFNATAWKGVEDAQKDLNLTTPKYLESSSQNDYAPNLASFVSQKCGLIVTVGFLMGDATAKSAKANPDRRYTIVDFSYSPALSNVLGLQFATDQGGFLGGYLAAGMSKSAKVGTFGGVKIPPVTIYMDGFWAGVKYYNKQKGTNVQVLGWNPLTQTGLFTGDFTNQDNGKRTAETLLSAGADIIFPVAGNVGLGAAAAVKAAGGNNHMLWVDTDGCISAPQYCSLFLSSVEKKIDVAVTTSIKTAANNTFKGGVYNGTLQNDGVGLAPFHDFDSQVPQGLKNELNTVKQGIINGTISVKPSDYK